MRNMLDMRSKLVNGPNYTREEVDASVLDASADAPGASIRLSI